MGLTTMKKTKSATVNEPVFTYVSKGVYSAKVFGYEVIFERALHNLWECRVVEGEEAGKLLAVAESRSKAMIEAYNNVLKREQKRLDWVLADQPLRTYGKRGQYKTDIELDKQRQDEEQEDFFQEEEEPKLKLVSKEKPAPSSQYDDEDDEDDKVPGKLKDFLTTEQKLRIKQFYKIRKNYTEGKGFVLAKFDSRGIYDAGYGPFDTAGEAYEKILELEGVEIPEQE